MRHGFLLGSSLIITAILSPVTYSMSWFHSESTTLSSTDPAKKTWIAANSKTPAMKEKQVGLTYCPPADKLFQENLVWKAPGGWQGHSSSFVKKIAHFSGAQWIGINVGKIVCIYAGETTNTFPVSIERDNLAVTPNSTSWGPDEGGYKNCKSNYIYNCGFKLDKKKKEKQAQSIYNEIRAIK